MSEPPLTRIIRPPVLRLKKKHRRQRGMGATGDGIMSAADIYQTALNAGFPPATAVKMVAIAMAESSGRPGAYNGKPPDASYGLWQINMIGNLGPQRRALLGIASNDALFDPATNARAAYMLWAGNDANLHNWTTYSLGIYLAWLPMAQSAGAAVNAANTGGDGSQPPASADSSIVDAVTSELATIDPTTLAVFAGLVVVAVVAGVA